MLKLRHWFIRPALFLLVAVLLTGCVRPSAPALTRLVPADRSTPAAATGSSPVNLGAGDALAILKDQLSSLTAASFSDPSQASSQRDAFLNAVGDAIKLTGTGEYDGARAAVKDKLLAAVDAQVAESGRSKLDQAIAVVLECIDNASRTTLDTRYGKVAGAAGYVDSWVWKGLPYAKPPVGDLRWRAPQDPDPWSGVRQSTASTSVACQPAVNASWMPMGGIMGTEDCLYLNVWRPKSDEKDLPVYFWIHGGGNNFGSGQVYEGSMLAARSNMVVVTINYRLGPLGWFNHPALKTGSKEDDSGNYGLLDAIKALQWVRDNIRSFGGDPGNVTVAGESAGGRNTLSLLICPLAAGLFQRAICESGGMATIPADQGVSLANTALAKLLVNDQTVADAGAAGDYIKKMTNDEIARYLRSKTPAELIKAETTDRGGMYLHSAFEDGYVIPGNLVATIATGKYNRMPVILGCNEYELKPFLPLYGGPIPTSNGHHWSDLYSVLNKSMSLDEVMPLQIDRDVYEACGYYGSRNWKATYLDPVARSLREKQDSVYCYFFKWGGPGSGPSPYDFIIGAGHATEIPFFFGWPKDTFGYSFTEANRAGREELQKQIMSYAARFALTGNPNLEGSGQPPWESWSNEPGAMKCIVFDATPDRATITTINDELTVVEVQAEIDKLPPLVKAVVRLWVRTPTG